MTTIRISNHHDVIVLREPPKSYAVGFVWPVIVGACALFWIVVGHLVMGVLG